MNLTPEQLAKVGPDHPIMQLMERMTAIEQKLAANDPEISTHLKEIMKLMGTYEELAHILTPDQIAVAMKGLQKHVGIQLVIEEQSGKKSGRSKSLKGVGVNDLV